MTLPSHSVRRSAGLLLCLFMSLTAAQSAWAKAAIFAALGYFISPVDAVPDVVPLLGFTDDLGVLAAALAATAASIKDEHVVKAKETMQRWFP